MDAVRAEATAIFAAEYQLLQQRQKVERSREQDILRIGIFIAAISVVLRFFIAWFLARLRKKGKSSSGDATT